MPQPVPPRLKSQQAQERLARLDESIARLEAAKRYPNHNDDLLKALRLERERIIAAASATPGPAEPETSRPRAR